MAVELLNCLDTTQYNKLITDCCCLVNCDLTNTYESTVRILDLAMSAGDFAIDNIYIDGNPISYPISINPNTSLVLSFTLCAPSTEQIGQLSVDIDIQGFGVESYSWDLASIFLSTFLSPTELNFGNVAIGNASTLYIDVPNSLLCCNDFYTVELQPPFMMGDGVTVCPFNEGQQIAVYFIPTELGLWEETAKIYINECGLLNVPLTGNAIEPPSGGGQPQKNKVDQTTRVDSCSPRTANNRCQTARTMQSAIRSNARRFGKR